MAKAPTPKLSRREQQIMDAVYRRGRAIAVEVRAALTRAPVLSSLALLALVAAPTALLRAAASAEATAPSSPVSPADPVAGQLPAATQVEVEVRMLTLPGDLALPERMLKSPTQLEINAMEQLSDVELIGAPKVTLLSGRRSEIVLAQQLAEPAAFDTAGNPVGGGSAAPPAEKISVELEVLATVAGQRVNYELTFTKRDVVHDSSERRSATTTTSVEVRSSGSAPKGETVSFQMGETAPGRKSILYVTFNEVPPGGMPGLPPVQPPLKALAPPPAASPLPPGRGPVR